jgi:hypothetical protein
MYDLFPAASSERGSGFAGPLVSFVFIFNTIYWFSRRFSIV